MNIFVTSDLHFGHHNIIEYCKRPFSDEKSMSEFLARNWNSVVEDDDFVFILGDVTLIRRPNKRPEIIDLIKSLKGKKVLIAGNHDYKDMQKFYLEIGWKIFRNLIIGDIFLNHYPIEVLSEKIKLVLHGHQHGQGAKKLNQIDVGVDAYKPYYYPIEIKRMLELSEEQKLNFQTYCENLQF